jgi:hypothetical protein
MNPLRQTGYLRYSRKAIQVYSEALREYLREQTGQAIDWNATGDQKVLSAT